MGKAQTNAKPVYALVGKDRFLRGEALDRLLRELEAEIDALGPTRVVGPEAELAAVLDDVRTPSLLGARRVVIVDDADEFISRYRAGLERYCDTACASGTLVLLCESLPKNTRLYKMIADIGEVSTVEPPKGRALVAWVVERSRTVHGKRCGEAVTARLIEFLGPSPGALNAELAKLAAYAGDRPEFAPSDVDAVTGNLREETVFAVTDAIYDGDVRSALAGWQQVLATDRAAPGRAIAGLAWGVRRLLDVQCELHRGTSLPEVSRRMFTDPNTAKRRLERATVGRLLRHQQDLLAADLAVKSGAATFDAAVERLIVKHTLGLADES